VHTFLCLSITSHIHRMCNNTYIKIYWVSIANPVLLRLESSTAFAYKSCGCALCCGDSCRRACLHLSITSHTHRERQNTYSRPKNYGILLAFTPWPRSWLNCIFLLSLTRARRTRLLYIARTLAHTVDTKVLRLSSATRNSDYNPDCTYKNKNRFFVEWAPSLL